MTKLQNSNFDKKYNFDKNQEPKKVTQLRNSICDKTKNMKM